MYDVAGTKAYIGHLRVLEMPDRAFGGERGGSHPQMVGDVDVKRFLI